MHVVKVRSMWYFILLMWGPCPGVGQSLRGVLVVVWVAPWAMVPQKYLPAAGLLPRVHLQPCPPQCPFPRAFSHVPQFFPFVPPSPGSYCLLLNTSEPRCGLPWAPCWCRAVSRGITAIWGSTWPPPTQGSLQPPVAKTCQFAPNTDAYSSAL